MTPPASRRVPERRPPATQPAPDWIGLGDATVLLGVSPATLRRWSDEGRIPVFTTPGGHRRYSRRALRAFVPHRGPRPTLARLGASAERIARAYRGPGRRHAAPVAPATGHSWLDGLGERDLAAFRARGRTLVEELLLHLDAGAESADAPEHLERAVSAATEHGREMARLGCSTVAAVETFLAFRAPFLGEMTRLARRRSLDAAEATGLLAAVEAALDRLLVATIEGHAEGKVGTGRETTPGTPNATSSTAAGVPAGGETPARAGEPGGRRRKGPDGRARP